MSSEAKIQPNIHINHIGISVPSLDFAIKWYSENLGFRVLTEVHLKRDSSKPRSEDIPLFRVYPEPLNEARIAFLISGNGVGVELFEFVDPKHTTTLPHGSQLWTQTGCFHIALTDSDPIDLGTRLIEAGAKALADPVVYGRNAPIVYLQDPCGLILEICGEGFEQTVSKYM